MLIAWAMPPDKGRHVPLVLRLRSRLSHHSGQSTCDFQLLCSTVTEGREDGVVELSLGLRLETPTHSVFTCGEIDHSYDSLGERKP